MGTGEVLLDGAITALAAADGASWAATSDDTLWRSDDGSWEGQGRLPDHRVRSILPTADGALVGTSEAHLYRLGRGSLELVGPFDRAPGRDDWYTPWGGPPDTRSLAAAPDGATYANVHVGGIVRSTDGGDSWEPTIDIDADVHQVVVHPDHPTVVLAACAIGLARSEDRGATWETDTEGLHATYCRGVAVAGDTVLVSASTGPFTDRAALYRVPFAGPPRFERCAEGLPEWFPSNIDSHCLAAAEGLAAAGTDDGSVYRSDDEGRTWHEVATGLPPVRAVVLVPD